MTDLPPIATVRELRARLRADLVQAMRERRSEVVSALRTAIAAIDNAEAVAPSDTPAPPTSEHIAGAHAGVGTADAPRRELSPDDARTLLLHQITERVTEADRYEEHDQADAAQRLRREAEALQVYVAD